MPRDLFGNVTDPSIKVGSRKWYTVPLSLAVHTLVLVAVVVVPLMATGALPMPYNSVAFVPVVSAPLPAPPPTPQVRTDRPLPLNRHAVPLDTPPMIAPEPAIDPGFENAVDRGTGFVDGLGVVTSVEPLPEPPPPLAPTKVRVGGEISPPQKIRDVPPVYPQIALSPRIQGLVIIEATIDVDGRVQDARVLRSDSALLDQSALSAVRQWIYTPTRLNGQPVSVVMTVTVRFTLQ